MELDIDGHSALVTASSSGLGKAAAEALVREGANVVINGRGEDQLAEAVEELDDAGPETVVGHAGDLTDENDIKALVQRPVDEFGGLDHLVTTSGGPPSSPFMETTDEDWYAAFDLLVMSVVRTVREAADHLQDGDGGTIVTITSRSVKEAVESLVLSNSVRMGVIGLEKTLSRELTPEVRANAVLPGPHETQRQRNLIQAGVDRGEYESYEDGLAARGESSPLGRIGQPPEFGRAVAFLSSPVSSYINGVALPIDGGLTQSTL